ncbi:MAG: thymidylate synthase (FAD) [Candidatus Muiribacterium halophilum]|uniref:Flavin-dependent thymidylate synthase n=1 Tax=Muiribacterium halophilum TaxID=2053465 RepID=A0A2N5ZBV9_MUIH1|nr:MAG: thymidylate synthase (FAD) [Candidatus Muirbacterium halophilum]
MLNVMLLSHTPQPEKKIAVAARLCYSKLTVSQLNEKLDDDTIKRLLQAVIERGHHSVLEHAIFTFGIDGVSRVCTHQLVRHRVASFAQQSQRYVKMKGELDYYTPVLIKRHEKANAIYEDIMKKTKEAYDKMLELGIDKEDARYALPSSTASNIIVTMNVRELFHFLELRMCQRAQDEIRIIAYKMYNILKEVCPIIFQYAGPTCKTSGICKDEVEECVFYKKYCKR